MAALSAPGVLAFVGVRVPECAPGCDAAFGWMCEGPAWAAMHDGYRQPVSGAAGRLLNTAANIGGPRRSSDSLDCQADQLERRLRCGYAGSDGRCPVPVSTPNTPYCLTLTTQSIWEQTKPPLQVRDERGSVSGFWLFNIRAEELRRGLTGGKRASQQSCQSIQIGRPSNP